jgi:hypothetical protein
MSIIHVTQIKNKLKSSFNSLIDLSDLQKFSDEDKENSFLSRALAAYTISCIAKIDNSKSAKVITDGFGDNGIDLVYFDDENDILYVIQSKLIHSGSGALSREDILPFLKGVKDLLNAKFDRFNKKIKDREQEIFEAIAKMKKMVIVITYTGDQKLSPHIEKDINDFLEELNDPHPIVTKDIFDQGKIYHFLSLDSLGENIKISDLKIHDWGLCESPYLAYYGQAELDQIAKIFEDNGKNLFAKNLRHFKGSTDVNDQIISTLSEKPENFWYFNNGITVLCSSIKKSALYTDRKIGIFECEGVSIINGAQTVGSILEAYKKKPNEVKNGRVHIRIISLENSSESFGLEITKYNNLQNKIENRDFAAQDPVHERIAVELRNENKVYIYKSGDILPNPNEGCSIEEATIALACENQDIGLSVIAKSNVGKLWENIEGVPYKLIFNSGTTSLKLWRSVEIMRILEKKLDVLRVSNDRKIQLISFHSNRFILHKIFSILRAGKVDLNNPKVDFESLKDQIISKIQDIFDSVYKQFYILFPDKYPANVFKSKTRCEELIVEVNKEIK